MIYWIARLGQLISTIFALLIRQEDKWHYWGFYGELEKWQGKNFNDRIVSIDINAQELNEFL